MKTNLFIVTLLLIFMSGCGIFKHNSSDDRGKCKLEDSRWLVVKDSYDSKQMLELATKMEVAAKADVEKLKAAGVNNSIDLKTSFTSDFVKIVEQSSKKETVVSQEFLELYRANRDAICNILYLIENVELTKEQKEKAVNSYIALNEGLSYVVASEKKKLGQN